MHSRYLLSVMAGMLLCSVSLAQNVSKDSITSLKQQKESLQINKRINDRKLQLAKLQNSLDQKTRDAQAAADEAQKSAEANSQAAAKLTTNAEDKSLANSAGKSAKDAKHDAKQARKAAADLDKLKKDISSLQQKIADDEQKLSHMPGNNPATVAMPDTSSVHKVD